jgi:hypothetical protein
VKVTKEQLRSIIRETVRRKLALGPERDDWVAWPRDPLPEGSLTRDQLQQVIDEEFAHAVTARGLVEEGTR